MRSNRTRTGENKLKSKFIYTALLLGVMGCKSQPDSFDAPTTVTDSNLQQALRERVSERDMWYAYAMCLESKPKSKCQGVAEKARLKSLEQWSAK